VRDAGLLLGSLLITGLAILVVTFIGALLLRFAVAIYNLLAGGADSESGVPEPRFLTAMGVALQTAVMIGGLSFLLAFARRAGNLGVEADGEERLAAAAFIFFLLSLVAVAGTLMVVLPTSLGKALFVSLCYMVMVTLLVGVVAGVGFAIWRAGMF
jgi:hypothetical protein